MLVSEVAPKGPQGSNVFLFFSMPAQSYNLNLWDCLSVEVAQMVMELFIYILCIPYDVVSNSVYRSEFVYHLLICHSSAFCTQRCYFIYVPV